jgi:DNA ligase-1
MSSRLQGNQVLEIDAFVRGNTLERYGPVRNVKPELVFEISFEDIHPSKRHKSGVTLTNPKLLGWRKDKNVSDIDTLNDLHSLLEDRA